MPQRRKNTRLGGGTPVCKSNNGIARFADQVYLDTPTIEARSSGTAPGAACVCGRREMRNIRFSHRNGGIFNDVPPTCQ